MTLAGPCHWVEPDLCSACAWFHEHPGEQGNGLLLTGQGVKRVDLEQLRLEATDIMLLMEHEPIQLRLEAVDALFVASALQLALRHPYFPKNIGEAVTAVAQALAAAVSITPDLKAVMEASWGPAGTERSTPHAEDAKDAKEETI